MTDGGRTDRRRAEVAGRVEQGQFDAALRPGSVEEALGEGPERYFALVAEVARAQFDPADHWDDFVRALWEQVDAGFGLTTSSEDDPHPPTWFDHPDDPPFVEWDQGEGDH